MFCLSNIPRISYPSHQASIFNPFLPTWPSSASCQAPPPAAPHQSMHLGEEISRALCTRSDLSDLAACDSNGQLAISKITY